MLYKHRTKKDDPIEDTSIIGLGIFDDIYKNNDRIIFPYAEFEFIKPLFDKLDGIPSPSERIVCSFDLVKLVSFR